MVHAPDDRAYSRAHLWVRFDDDFATVGVTDELSDVVGDFVSIDLPSSGDELEIDVACLTFHLKNDLHEVASPLTGRVLEVNPEIVDEPNEIFSIPYGNGWLFTMEYDEPDEVDLLLEADDYSYFLEEH